MSFIHVHETSVGSVVGVVPTLLLERIDAAQSRFEYSYGLFCRGRKQQNRERDPTCQLAWETDGTCWARLYTPSKLTCSLSSPMTDGLSSHESAGCFVFVLRRRSKTFRTKKVPVPSQRSILATRSLRSSGSPHRTTPMYLGNRKPTPLSLASSARCCCPLARPFLHKILKASHGHIRRRHHYHHGHE